MAASAAATMSAFLPAPSGYIVDFDHPQRNNLPLAYWLTGVSFVCAVFALAMRIYTRTIIVKDFKIEDWFIVGSFLFSVATQALVIHTYVIKSGATHAWEMPIERYNYQSVMVIVAADLYVVCLALAKASFLAFYYRMSQLRWLKVTSLILGVIIISYSLALIFALIFACKPIAYAWDVRITDGHCINRPAVYVLLAVLNIVTDVILLILPIPMVWKLQMPWQQKVGVVIVFLIGSATCVTSVVRLVLLLRVLGDADQPWAIAVPSMWVNIEANLIIICCSLPALRLFMRHFAPKLMGELSLTRSRTGNTGHGTGSNMGGGTKDRLSRINSGYDRMDSVGTGGNKSITGYALEERPRDKEKGWTESRCEYTGHRVHPGFDFSSHLDDATTSTSDLSTDENVTERPHRDLEDGGIMKMEAFSVVSERRVV